MGVMGQNNNQGMEEQAQWKTGRRKRGASGGVRSVCSHTIDRTTEGVGPCLLGEEGERKVKSENNGWSDDLPFLHSCWFSTTNKRVTNQNAPTGYC